MYNRSLQKLSINRQFERAIKEVAIDCSINEYGNIVRLEEMYTPNIEVNGTWNLVYQNYSTGENFIRLNTRSQFQNLKDNVFTLQDILANTAKNSKNFIFTNTLTGEQKKINKSFIVLSARFSCQYPKIPLGIMMPRIIKPSRVSPTAIETKVANSKIKIIGELNWRTNIRRRLFIDLCFHHFQANSVKGGQGFKAQLSD
jgi:hypothetical protein